MNDGQNTLDIQPLIIKFSALTCPSSTRCTKCVKVQTVHDAYHDMGLRMASCDKCEHTLYHMDVVLHCPPNHRHHDGYDLCVKCGEIILKRQQKEQQSLLRQVAKDKKRKMAERENTNTDPNMQPPPKKKRKRGRPRKYPLPSPPAQYCDATQMKLNTRYDSTPNKKEDPRTIHHAINHTDTKTSINPVNTHPINPIIESKPHNVPLPAPQATKRTLAPHTRTIWRPRAESVPNIPQTKSNGHLLRKVDAKKADTITQRQNNPSFTHYRDWEDQLMRPQFTDDYIKYLRTAPNLCDNSIKIINRYASWLDFVRLNEGSEMNILNTLCEFESILAHDAVNHVNAQTLKELNHLEQYLITSDMDYKHIWNNAYTNRTQINEHNAIAKYASNYMAHNSLHQTLFGDPSDPTLSTSWKEISQMIEQSHFIRDWKLNLIDSIIQKQIDILQSLITQHGTIKNSLTSNSNVLTPSDLRINIWKRHILKLRNIRMRSNVGLEFPMNVLKYDRTEIDHIAKIAAINGIQQSITDHKNTSKPALPSNSMNASLTLRDLLPPNLKPAPASALARYAANNSNNSVSSSTTNNTAHSYTPPNKDNALTALNAMPNINGFNHNQQQHSPYNNVQFQPPPQKQQQREKPKPVYNPANNVQQSTPNITHLIQNITTNRNIDINKLIHVLSNAQNSVVSNSKQNAVLQQITQHLLAKRQQQQQQPQPQPRREIPSFPVAPSMYNKLAPISQLNPPPTLQPSRNIPMLIHQERPQSDDDSSSIEFLKEIRAPPSAPGSSVKVTDPNDSRRIIGATPHNIFRIYKSNDSLHGPRLPLNIPKLRPLRMQSMRVAPIANAVPMRDISSSRIDLTNNSPPPLMAASIKTDESLEPIIKTGIDAAASRRPSSGDSGDTVISNLEMELKREETPYSVGNERSNKKVSPEIDFTQATQVYSDKKYWDKFHGDQKLECFEWFCNYVDIADVLDQHIGNKDAKILEIGCGLSSMASRMVLDNGYKDILCLDWCDSAVNKIKGILDAQYQEGSNERQLLNEHIQYTVQDIRSMTFERRTFDVVIDKGTMDAIDCGVSVQSDICAQARLDGSGRDNLSDNFEEIVAICSRIHEILKPNGLFIIVTSRSIVKRIEFVDELKATHKRHFQKVYGDNIETELKDWRDGDSKTPKLIILMADKNSRKHKHKKT